MTTRVLLAEDNADHAFFTVRAFRSVHGDSVEIETVPDGEQALDYMHRRGAYADRQRPHLVILDIRMPRVDGLTVLQEIKENADLRSIPVVVLSSSDRADDIEDTYRRGGNSYVTKPSTLDGLRHGVRDLATYWVEVATLPQLASD